VHAAASEIATGTDDLSGRTESQARQLQEVAVVLAELGDAVRQNADGANRVTTATGSALTAARGGSSVVGEAVERMAEIREASRRVADITGVIDGIAFQTNILALNAAVEAARAGEQGRGFAVVASEVRALAQRSAASAREIKALIEDASLKVQAGAQLVESVGHSMGDILESVGRVENTMQSIADASRRQESGIERVDAMLGRIEEATQRNAALAEETSAATGSLTQQSDGLSASAQRFVVQPRREAKVKPVRTAA
jgi:methyl-accepting chemotaxis protein